jgi:hypothetical protein
MGAPAKEDEMSTYHVVKADGTGIDGGHARRRGAIGTAVIALVEGGETGCLRVIKRKHGHTEVERAEVRRGEDGRFSITLAHDVAEPIAATTESVEPVAAVEPVADGD